MENNIRNCVHYEIIDDTHGNCKKNKITIHTDACYTCIYNSLIFGYGFNNQGI